MLRAKLKISNNPWIVFWVTAIGVGMASLDAGIVNVALPTIAKQFHVGLGSEQWIVTGFLLVLCMSLPLCGKLGDLYSKSNVYLLGFIVFVISSALCGLAFSLWSLVLFRLLQGLGAAMILANNQPIILSCFPKEKRGRALGVNATLIALGGITGPGLGGFIMSFVGWRGLFYINIPIGILGCILGYFILPRTISAAVKKIDFLGVLLFASSMFFLVMVLTHAIHWGWNSWLTITSGTLAVMLLVAFIHWERIFSMPMIPLAIMKNKLFGSGVTLAFIIIAAFAINNILLPFYLQNILHVSTRMIGFCLLLPPLFILLIAPLSGFLADYYNPVKITEWGLIITLFGLLIESVVTVHSSIWQIIIAQILFGIGNGLFIPPNNVTIYRTVVGKQLSSAGGVASFMLNIARIFGISAGVAILTNIELYAVSLKTDHDIAFVWGFRMAFWVASILILIGIILAFSRRSLLKSADKVK